MNEYVIPNIDELSFDSKPSVRQLRIEVIYDWLIRMNEEQRKGIEVMNLVQYSQNYFLHY